MDVDARSLMWVRLLHGSFVHTLSDDDVCEIVRDLGAGATIGWAELFEGARAAQSRSLMEELSSACFGINGASHIYEPELTVAHWAAVLGRRALCVTLLSLGVPLDVRNAGGMTPLHMACLWGNPDTAHTLVWSNADVEAECQGLRPIHLAAMCGHASVVAMLVRNGADAGALSSSSKRTPLMYAEQFGNLDAADALRRTQPDKEEPWNCCEYY
jgi:hypothetical protein